MGAFRNGYDGPDPVAVFDLTDSLPEMLRGMAREGGSRMTAAVRYRTPVGHRPFEPGYVPGHLLASIRQKLLVVYFSSEHRAWVYESGTETDVSYGPYVEHGTGLWGPLRAKYEIRPKRPGGWLRFWTEAGDLVFARRVLHPGSPGAHMFVAGAAATEAEFSSWAEEYARDWCSKMERRIVERAAVSRLP